MDFDFLPKLPKSNLDDRTFDDLVEECLLRIPRYCPEWTNYNPSDPGITIIELFAWLTDQMLLRFNQVPRRNYVAFLELLGIRLEPPQSAKTHLTFYLSAARSENLVIEAGTEVATQRQDVEEPITFSTDSDWAIGTPQITTLLTATKDTEPSANDLRNLFEEDGWQQNEENGEWFREDGLSSEVFQNQSQSPSQRQWPQRQSPAPQPDNCFYLVLAPQPLDGHLREVKEGEEGVASEGQENAIAGNVIAITFKGREAATTGIDPNNPPRRWEVWNGQQWVSEEVLRRESDDRTKGFSFEKSADSPNLEQGADVILHLPTDLPETDFGTNHRGYWLRCVYKPLKGEAYNYDRSPQISSISVRSIGATVPASHCTWIKDEEFLGVSNGKPGQTFELLNKPVLPRYRRECIQVRSPMFEHSRQTWQEVENFSRSDEDSPHYTIDSNRGIIQFGPLIREPKGLPQKIQRRYRQQQEFQSQLQLWQNRRGRLRDLPASELEGGGNFEERQYGKIPPKGWEIYMVSYRTGGGAKGNVREKTLEKLMISLPYIRAVTNYKKAEGGAEADSLERAVMKVPGWLRTGDRAVTREDFETLIKQVEGVPLARTCCLKVDDTNRGQVTVLGIPQLEPGIDLSCGMKAKDFQIENKEKLEEYLNDRTLLGTRVEVSEPTYVRIGARVTLGIETREARDIEEKVKAVKIALYQLLHPIFGGLEGKGWEFDRAVRSADIATCCQRVPDVLYIENVQLFRIEPDVQNFDYPEWQAKDIIHLEANEMIYSWQNTDASKGLNFIQLDPQSLTGSIKVQIDI